VTLSPDGRRRLRELAEDTGWPEARVLDTALKLLAITRAIHGEVHGVIAPVADPRGPA